MAQPCSLQKSYLRATHYWGNAWPITFWDTLELHQVPSDFEKIKSDGFDAIIIAIPWGHFHHDPELEVYNSEAFTRLKYIFKQASLKQLKVILRLNYFWDFDDDAKEPLNTRFDKLFYDETALSKWAKFLKQIYSVSRENESFLFGFLTWEDYWHINRFTFESGEQRKKWSKKLKYDRFKKFKVAVIPAPRDPDLANYYSFIDNLLVNRIYRTAKKSFPKLSMEVRSDFDPVFDEKGRKKWFEHSKTYNLPHSDCTVIYHGISAGAQNVNDFISAEQAINLFNHKLLQIFKGSHGSTLFIDQFLYFDNTPTFSYNTRVKPEELERFISESVGPLQNYTSGYALWAHRDYAASAIFNGSFELGLKGWLGEGNVGTVLREGDRWAEVSYPGSLTQHISELRTGAAMFETYPTARFCFRAQAQKAPAQVNVRLDSDVVIQKNLSSLDEESICADVPKKRSYTVTVASLQNSVLIDDLVLYAYVFETKLYDVNNTEKPLAAAIRNLNSQLEKKRERPVVYLETDQIQLGDVSADGWVFSSITGKIRIPEDLKNKVFALKTWLPENWPGRPKVKIRVGPTTVTCSLKTNEDRCLISLSRFKELRGQEMTFFIETSKTISPLKAKLGSDKRELGFVFKGFGFFDEKSAN